MATKKLIEVALPLEKINTESAREKNIRFGHPSTLHLWWARRPLAAARAVLWASLVDDPSSHPELFPTEEEQGIERQRLFKILEDLVVWENSNDEKVLSEAKKEITKYTNGKKLTLLDPFAGGGAIPLEAQRLGLEVYAHDLNPVAVMINKAMIEIPARFEGCPAVNAEERNQFGHENGMAGATALASDVEYYGNILKKEAYKRIGQFYPLIDLPSKYGKGKTAVISWIWARTVKCPNPACGNIVPLMNSFWLSKKKGKEAYIKPVIDNHKISFQVIDGVPTKNEQAQVNVGTKYMNENGKGKHATFCCPFCNSGVVTGEYADAQAEAGKMGAMPVAVVAEGNRRQIYLPIDETEYSLLNEEIDNYYEAHEIEEKVSHARCRGTFASNAQGRYYGMHEFKDYFTKRQLIALTTFCDVAKELQERIEKDAIDAGMKNDHIPLNQGGNGALAYGQAISVYLAFAIDRETDLLSSMATWINSIGAIRNTFARQGIAMSWDYAEVNPFSQSAGCFDNMLSWITRCLKELPASGKAHVKQHDAQTDADLRNVIVSTDPPYYDNICYSDLSDYFYVWMRQTLQSTYPELFSTMLVPKSEELIANSYRFDGSAEKAKQFFENGMLNTCKQIYKYSTDDVPITIYYAYKEGESTGGWETMLSAIINAGLRITGTWPMRTEREVRTVASNANALASSIVLVCRKREENAASCTRRSFINELKRELRSALIKLQESNIAPVDLAQSAIGPGIGVFSKYKQILEADGTPMSVSAALQVINQEVDIFFNEQDGELDTESRFCVDLYSQMAFNEMPFGDANTLATAKNTSVAIMASHGTLYAQKGKVHLIERPELPTSINEHEGSIWLLCQQLTYKMEKEGIEGCATAIANMYGSNAERAKDLAYRLYTIAERKKWAQEAYAYNALVVAWPEIQSRAAELKAIVPQQLTLEDFMNNNN